MGVEGHERYINPYTDFGFKKLFGKRLFEQAEIAGFTPQERKEYQESVKDYWDYYSTVKTAHKKGREEGRTEEKYEIARKMKQEGMEANVISKLTNLPIEEISSL